MRIKPLQLVKAHLLFCLFIFGVHYLTAQPADSGSIIVASGSDDIEKLKELRMMMIESKSDSLDQIETYLQDTKIKAIQEENPGLLAQVSYNLGLLYFNQENYIKAIPPLQSALDNISDLNYLDSLILYNNITIAFTEIRAYNSAVQYVSTLEHLIYKDTEAYSKIKNNVTSLDGLYYNLGMYEDAIRIFRLKKSRGENLNKAKPKQYAVDLYDFARYFSANQQPDSALHYYQIARNMVESSNFENKEYFLGLIKGSTAEAFIQQDKYQEAIPLLKEDYVASLRAKDYQNSARNLNILAYCELKVNELDNALRHLQGVRELINRKTAPDIHYTNTLYLSKTFGALSQYDSAYLYAKRFIQLTDSIASSRNIEKSAQLAVSVELRHKEEIMQKALLQIHQEKQRSIKDQQYLKWILIAAVILAILFVIALYLLRKRSSQKTRLQELIVNYEQKTQLVEKSLHEKEYLLKEIHHRVKNNLQIVSGILQLQAVHSKNKEFKDIMKQSQNRIQSMALIHQMLYQNDDIRYIPFKSYLEKLSTQIMSALMIDFNKIKINIITEEIKLDVETAIPLGLIVNELVSNAIKYAYPNNQEGMIDVWLKQDSSEDYTLIVADDGVGLPNDFNLDSTNTLGLQLVRMLSKQMNSKLTYRNNGGAEFSIKFSRQNQEK
ncbi:sensor histidine kinase [bacterium SCSIO 12643]|nr:sensor histidine kinase [bacterium SCSIO 12643]